MSQSTTEAFRDARPRAGDKVAKGAIDAENGA